MGWQNNNNNNKNLPLYGQKQPFESQKVGQILLYTSVQGRSPSEKGIWI